ncbi:hypothetical protein [Sodalis-like endosymbiont of Proechinophthirus fluctus]|uniref:hypothetical protein n=1 Tax=Sodalis-like endosymbiont of Proechinophthirus fluctus TaxID=1462730 RepID=UPI0016506DAF|nr:hypothetical protein [Sodalis-like endosymbiont of Proechinophthirus fluctus]
MLENIENLIDQSHYWLKPCPISLCHLSDQGLCHAAGKPLLTEVSIEPVFRADFILHIVTYALCWIRQYGWICWRARITHDSLNRDRLTSRLVAEMMHLVGAALH